MELRRNVENIVIIGAYAPNENADAQEKRSLYIKLFAMLVTVKRQKEIHMLGDLNARVGRKDNNTVIGAYGKETTNDQLLMEFCVTNGFIPHKDVHKFMWG